MSIVAEITYGMMTASIPSDYWLGITNSVLLSVEFPELELSHSVKQRDRRSVWEHTMLVMDALSDKNPITLLSGLFHDLGKYYVDPNHDPAYSRYPGHAAKSAEIAERRLKEWGADKNTTDSVVRLVNTHMFDIRGVTQDKTIRKFVASVGKNNIENWFVLRVADSLSYSGHQQYRNTLIEPFRAVVMSYLKRQPDSEQVEFKNLDVTGGVQIKGGDEE